ncbi:hypothetical protein QFZ25_000961 [Bacillus atrophaeus]|nr:hypothetical protein [Bacillus atrophaeus]
MIKLIDTCWCQVQYFFIKSYNFIQNAKKCWHFQKNYDKCPIALFLNLHLYPIRSIIRLFFLPFLSSDHPI